MSTRETVFVSGVKEQPGTVVETRVERTVITAPVTATETVQKVGVIERAGTRGSQGAPGRDGTDGTDGVDGKSVIYGTGVPNDTVGQDGEFYISTDAHLLFGPKENGAWPAGVSIIGPQGPAGGQGPKGDRGPQGELGPLQLFLDSAQPIGATYMYLRFVRDPGTGEVTDVYLGVPD